jgi:transcriptional regulator with XRE-family HTH domain
MDAEISSNHGGASVETVQIDIDQLAHFVHWKMDQEKLSLREAARKARVSAATMSRILRKGNRPRPDVDTLVKIVHWVDVPIERIVDTKRGSTRSNPPQTNTPEAIEVHLRADKNLTPEAAEAIAKMVRVAYAQFVKAQHRSQR